MKKIILLLLAISSSFAVFAGSTGSSFGAGFGGGLLGGLTANALSQPREPRTQVVQVERAPAQDTSYSATRQLRAQVKELQQIVDEQDEEIANLKQQVKKLKADNKRLQAAKACEHGECHTKKQKIN